MPGRTFQPVAGPIEAMVDASLLSYRTGRYGIILTAVWTMIAAASLAWNLWQQSHDMVETARVYARAAFERDVLFRAWNAGHGGVYVPVTEASPPNPHLRAPERDIVTPSGRLLTLINPSYMTRQIHEMGRERTMITGHITSLDPIRPANAPDDWERRALEAFERGVDEVSEITMLDGEAHLRLMQPLITERACLACHRQQGYSEGDIRGGISESVHLAPLQDMRQSQARLVAGAHGLLWLLGMAGIVFGTRRLTRVHEMLRKLSRAIEQSPATVLVTDTEGRIEYVNPQFTRVTGYMPDEVLGQNPRILKSGLHGPETYRELWATITAGRVWRGELCNRRKDGSLYWDIVAIAPIADAAGRISHYIGIQHDVTESKDLESQLRDLQDQLLRVSRLSELGQMASALAHEINQPLATMKMASANALALLDEGGPPERLRPKLVRIDTQVDRARRITDQIRRLVRRGDARPQTLFSPPDAVELAVGAGAEDIDKLDSDPASARAVSSSPEVPCSG